jgi:hypothetical protein
MSIDSWSERFIAIAFFVVAGALLSLVTWGIGWLVFWMSGAF